MKLQCYTSCNVLMILYIVYICCRIRYWILIIYHVAILCTIKYTMSHYDIICYMSNISCDITRCIAIMLYYMQYRGFRFVCAILQVQTGISRCTAPVYRINFQLPPRIINGLTPIFNPEISWTDQTPLSCASRLMPGSRKYERRLW